ncbi:MAG TPA: murein biosynthesis integral membrane protein MurJ [Gemmatimonadaceae bacterium]|nr:murein biosynthesis integral membrane protein MurJ [Gemmatimonadaceae bacterium]
MNRDNSRGAAFLVGAGIFLSRIAGLVRNKFFAHYFGSSLAADALNAAIRIPNLLQNLFGEGVLSASFIPAYSQLLAQDRKQEAERLAGVVAVMLSLISAVVVLAGIMLAPSLVSIIAGGFTGPKRDLAVQLTRILFPGAGLLVLSAWCLGILNSHRKFFISYTAPVVWNLAMIGALVGFGSGSSQLRLAEIVAWASVVGSALQFGVQLPFVIQLARVNLNTAFRTESSQSVFRNFIPAFISRGVVQISAYVDALIASWLPTGAVAVFSYAQVLYVLPVSLFGMAVSAAELPEMSRAVGTDEEIASYLRGRLDGGLARIAFYIVPSAIGFLALGDVMSAVLFESGRFMRSDSIWVWQILAGSTVGLLASTWGRLYSSTFYALRDTRTPLRFAIIRVVLTTVLGYIAALKLPGWLGFDPRLGVAGLTASAGIAGWVEFFLLRRGISRRIGSTGSPASVTIRLWIAAIIAAAIAWGAKLTLTMSHRVIWGLIILAIYGIAYLGITVAMRIPEANELTSRIRRRVR